MMMRQRELASQPINRNRGSALIVVLLSSFVAFMILKGFIPSVVTDYRATMRTTAMNSAYYIAEAGAEEAVWVLNNLGNGDWSTESWTESSDGGYWYREMDLSGESMLLDNDWKANVRIVAEKVNGSNPVKIYSQGFVDIGNNKTISKLIVVNVEMPAYYQGLIAKDMLTLNGKPTINSYNSNDTPIYSDANSTCNVTAGSVSSGVSSVSLGNATICGGVVSGANDPVLDGAVVTGPNATISGDVVGNFNMDFPLIDAPDTTGWPTTF